MGAIRASLAVLVAGTALAACGGGEEPAREDAPARAAEAGGREGAGPDDRGEAAAAPRPAPPALPPARCPAGATNCRSADGRVIFVERIDPDGDGDAHFVLASDESVTAPGVTVVDVRRDLRPRPLPGPGDLLGAAGPVLRGSYGQRQIQAEVVRVAHR